MQYVNRGVPGRGKGWLGEGAGKKYASRQEADKDPFVGAADRRDPPRHRFAAAPSDRGGVPQRGGGGSVTKFCMGAEGLGEGEGDRIQVCLFQTLLGRKPRRILTTTHI